MGRLKVSLLISYLLFETNGYFKFQFSCAHMDVNGSLES